MCSKNSINKKVGETLSFTCVYKTQGVATPLSGIDIESVLKSLDSETEIDAVVTILPEVGSFVVNFGEALEVNSFKCDIKFTKSGVITKSNTFYVSVVESVT